MSSLKAGVDLVGFVFGRAVVALVQVLMLQLFLFFPLLPPHLISGKLPGAKYLQSDAI